jgi:hypothetical protein
MKRWILFFNVLVVVFSSSAVISHAYDATGMWNYSERNPWNNCPGYEYDPVSGEVGILQTGSTFLIVDDDFSTYGNVSGITYTYSDKFCFMEGVVSENDSITLTSETTGTGTVSWSWSGDGSCSGGHEVTLSKQTQAAAVYDATGKWNFNQSGFFHNCDSASTPRSSGYFEVTQTGNKITAVDDQGQQYSGFVNGAEYAVVRSYMIAGGRGRNTDWVIITLSSGTQGSGTANFVWDDDCDDCNGSWSISVTKEIQAHTITASADPGGSISPSGSVSVDHGATQYFSFTPDPGYMVVSILYNETLNDARNWPGVYVTPSGDRTLVVNFERIGAVPGIPLLLLDE